MDVRRALEIRGYMHRMELHWLAEQAQACQARAHQARRQPTVLEIGCHRGRSTRALGDHIGRGTVIAVDPWRGPYLDNDDQVHKIETEVFEEFSENLRDLIATHRVRPYQMAFADAAPIILKTLGPRSVDLVFIDGDHRYAAVRDDIARALVLVRPDGVLAGHDYGHDAWPGVKQAVDEAFGAKVQVFRHIWWVP